MNRPQKDRHLYTVDKTRGTSRKTNKWLPDQIEPEISLAIPEEAETHGGKMKTPGKVEDCRERRDSEHEID